MVYTFLISIVFIAEIIIAITVIQNLLKLDKTIISFDETLTTVKPSLKDVCELCTKISGQSVEFSKRFVDKFKRDQEDAILRALSKLLIAIMLLKINSKAINSFRKSKTGRFLAKGLSLLENMV